MKLAVFILSLLLVSCASAPKPVTIDGRDRTPINGPSATRLLKVMAEPIPEEVIEEEDRLFTRELDPDTFIELNKDGTVSRIIHVPFLFAGTTFRPTVEQQYRMRRLSTIADRVEVRGRTDGVGTLKSNRKIALERAMAAKRYLIDRGIPAEMISVSYVANGNHVGDESTKDGRARNRRVEIEFHVNPEV